jgi:hypothetical protein
MGCLAGQTPTDNSSSEGAVSIVVDNGAVSARFRDQPIHEVCRILARNANIGIVLAAGLGENPVPLEVNSAPLDTALQALFARYDTFVFYGASNNASPALSTVWVFAKGSGVSV